METGQKEIATQAFLFVTFKISNWCQSTHHEILHMEINLNFKKKNEMCYLEKQQNLKKWFEIEKKMTFGTERFKTGIW